VEFWLTGIWKLCLQHWNQEAGHFSCVYFGTGSHTLDNLLHESNSTDLHDCCLQFFRVHDSFSEHGLCKLTEQSNEVPHPITRVGRRWHHRYVLSEILVLVKQCNVETLEEQKWNINQPIKANSFSAIHQRSDTGTSSVCWCTIYSVSNSVV